MNKKTQTSEVLKYLETHKKGITSMDAIELFGATRLSSLIFSLRKQGHNIVAKSETGKNRYGRATSYARYVLEDK